MLSFCFIACLNFLHLLSPKFLCVDTEIVKGGTIKHFYLHIFSHIGVFQNQCLFLCGALSKLLHYQL